MGSSPKQPKRKKVKDSPVELKNRISSQQPSAQTFSRTVLGRRGKNRGKIWIQMYDNAPSRYRNICGIPSFTIRLNAKILHRKKRTKVYKRKFSSFKHLFFIIVFVVLSVVRFLTFADTRFFPDFNILLPTRQKSPSRRTGQKRLQLLQSKDLI